MRLDWLSNKNIRSVLKTLDSCPYCKKRMDEVKAHAAGGHVGE